MISPNHRKQKLSTFIDFIKCLVQNSEKDYRIRQIPGKGRRKQRPKSFGYNNQDKFIGPNRKASNKLKKKTTADIFIFQDYIYSNNSF